MAGKKTKTERKARGSKGVTAEPREGSRAQVSGRWLLGAIAMTVGAAVFCAWCALCLLFWQGSWQLLYHPAATIARTPANVGLAFDAVGLAATDAGTPRLAGWWISAAPDARFSRVTVLYLHGQDGNLGDTVGALAQLHAAGVNVLAFDYRGYGQSQFVRPSEARWREDAEWALQYLIGTRHIAPGAIVLDGAGLGADLALELAAAHPELAGAIVESPLDDPMRAVFDDARGRMVPARLLVRDRYDLDAAAAEIRVPVLWFQPPMHDEESIAFAKVASRKMMVSIAPVGDTNRQVADALGRWLDELAVR